MAAWEGSLEHLVRERGTALLRYAALLCGSRAEAEDLVQEALVRTFVRGSGSLDPATAESSVRRAVLHGYIDGFRRRRRWDAVRHLLAWDDRTPGHESAATEAELASAERQVADDASAGLVARLDALAGTVRRRRARRAAVRAVAGAAAAAALVVGAGAVSRWVEPPAEVPAAPVTTDAPDEREAEPTPDPSAPVPCAEFPVEAAPRGHDYEGWWSSSPADADANVVHDPAAWPAIMRDHPRTILVDTSTGQVVSAWDRLACTSSTPAPPPADPAWPTDSVVVLDADTGAVVDSFPKRSAG